MLMDWTLVCKADTTSAAVAVVPDLLHQYQPLPWSPVSLSAVPGCVLTLFSFPGHRQKKKKQTVLGFKASTYGSALDFTPTL